MSLVIESSVGRTERAFAQGEKSLNVCGYIPFVSSISGVIRSLAGIVQVIAFGILASMAALSGSKALSQRYACTMINGFANIFRGLVETMFIIGNILCYVYDGCGTNFKYIGERMDAEAIRIRMESNVELANSRTPELSCF